MGDDPALTRGAALSVCPRLDSTIEETIRSLEPTDDTLETLEEDAAFLSDCTLEELPEKTRDALIQARKSNRQEAVR